MTTFICKECGNPYNSNKPESKFCSINCKKKYNSINYNCDYCNKPMIIPRSRLKKLEAGKSKHLYCSRQCVANSQNKKVIKICKNCNKSYSIGNCFKDIQKFCSRECYDIYQKEHLKSILIKKCPICNNEFTTKQTHQIYCSVNCRSKSSQNRIECTCDYCNKKFERIVSEVKKNKRHYCSKQCMRNDLYWSMEDVDILINNYKKISNKEIQNMLSTKWSVEAIKRKAQLLGITKSSDWTETEIDILISNYSIRPLKEIVNMLAPRTIFSVLGKAHSLGLKGYYYLNNTYSDKEIEFLKNNYLSMSNQQLADSLDRTPSAISQHLYVLGLFRPKEKTKYNTLAEYVRGRLTPWINQTKQKYNYTCQITGQKSNIVLHHIRGFSLLLEESIDLLNFPIYEKIEDYTKNQLDLLVNSFFFLQDYYQEYICISETIHKDFHSKYGYGNNTKEQWTLYISNL